MKTTSFEFGLGEGISLIHHCLKCGCQKKNKLSKEDNFEKTLSFTHELNNSVNEISWLLNQIIERNVKENQSKDPLTNMLSRRYIDSVLKREIDISIKQNQKFAILMIDLDNFKDINDTYGHDIGDRLLQEVADRIRRTCRKSDQCGRLAGDEFVVLLPEVDE